MRRQVAAHHLCGRRCRARADGRGAFRVPLDGAIVLARIASVRAAVHLRAVRREGRRALAAHPHRRTARQEDAYRAARSEEHTSELQSLRHLVCRLLLEKKKNKNNYRTKQRHKTRRKKSARADRRMTIAAW